MPPQTAATVRMLLLAWVLALLGGGCATVQYVVQQGIGQLNMLAHSVPIEDVLAAGQLAPEQERKLRLVVAARDFARQELGLRVGRSFSLYHETSGEPIGYNLSAAPQDALTPKQWRFPIIGTLDYIGFFSLPDAEQAAAELQQQGYDTYIYGVDAYSTLGWFPDPLQSKFLDRSDGVLVETVIHELAHNTIYVNGQSTFNETLATFIGRQGAQLFFGQRSGAGQEILAGLQTYYEDQERITTWIMDLAAALRAHYAQEISREEKIAGREAVFQAARARFSDEVQPSLHEPQRHAGWASLPTNNAFVLLHQRYHLDLDAFAALYEQSADFAAFLDQLRAAAGSADPFAYLRQAAGSP